MKKTFAAVVSAAALLAATPSLAEDVKVGVLLGFTGPLESLAGHIASGAELAIAEVSDSGDFLDGSTVTAVRGDSTCIDAGAATTAAERLITSDGVSAIVGAMCSGATTAALQNAALPNGTVMISPSATSPALSTVEDNGLFFRTAPSDARQGEIVAEILGDRGVGSVAAAKNHQDPEESPDCRRYSWFRECHGYRRHAIDADRSSHHRRGRHQRCAQPDPSVQRDADPHPSSDR